MPSFSAFPVVREAKPAVIRDFETFTTDSSTGQTVPTFPSTNTAFLGVPIRTGTGVWKVTLKDPTNKCIGYVDPIITTGGVVTALMQPNTTVAATGQTVLNWTFLNSSGVATDLGVSKQFSVEVMYSDSSVV